LLLSYPFERIGKLLAGRGLTTMVGAATSGHVALHLG